MAYPLSIRIRWVGFYPIEPHFTDEYLGLAADSDSLCRFPPVRLSTEFARVIGVLSNGQSMSMGSSKEGSDEAMAGSVRSRSGCDTLAFVEEKVGPGDLRAALAV